MIGALLAAVGGCSCSGDGDGDASRDDRAAAERTSAEPRARASDATATSASDAAAAAAVARPRHTLTGTVRTFDGRALPGAVVRADPVPVFPHAPDPRTPSETTADAEGAFSLPSLEAGDWALLVSAEGALGTYAATVRVPERERFDIVLPRGSVIEGTVIDETTRAPVGGARVRLRGESHSWIGDVRSSADGRFAMALFDEPRQGDWRIDVDGYAAELAESSNAAVAFELRGRHEVTLVAQRGRTLTGRVVGPDGPIAGARVTVRAAGDREPEDGRAATTDADGRYDVRHLSPWADFFVAAEAAGFVQGGEPDPDVAGLEPPLGDLVDVAETGWTAPDIEMRRRLPIGRCSIAGVVVDEEEHPVAGVPLVTQHRVGAVRATSEADGSFVLADVPTEAEKGSVEILCAPSGDWEGSQSVDTQTGVAVRDVRVYVSPIARPHVRGRVLAPDRTPVADARVVAVASSANQLHCFAPVDAVWVHGFECRTAADGTFDVELRFTGEEFAIVVEAAAFATSIRDMQLSEVIEKPLEVVLAAPLTVTGRAVRSGSDIGIAGLSVSLVRHVLSAVFTDVGERFPDDRVVATTAADGSFRVAGLSVTSDSLRIGGPGWMDAKVEIDEDSPTQVGRVEIEPALELAGRAQLADGSPCSGVAVTVHGADPDALDVDPQSRQAGDPPVRLTVAASADGAFSIGPVAAGRYWLEFEGGTPQVIRRVAGPFDAGTRDLRVELVCGSTIRGRVVGPDGQPVERVAVGAVADGRKGTSGETKCDCTGAFAIGGLDRGPHTITVEGDGYFTWTRGGVRASDEPLAVRLDEGLVVAGVLVGEDGEGISFVPLVVTSVDEPSDSHAAETDVDGRFRVAALTKGRWRIEINSPSRADGLDETIVEAGSSALVLRATRGGPVLGTPPAKDGR